MCLPNLIDFAVEQGWWFPDSGKEFNPARIYAPNDAVYVTRRTWRAFDIVAPSLNLNSH
ncbi:dipeptidase [Sporohalobacter salinus]|nr:dipeptidase [Sporohalobacter salinus]